MSEHRQQTTETFPSPYIVEFWTLAAGAAVLLSFLLLAWVLEITGFGLLSTEAPISFGRPFILAVPLGAALAIIGAIRGTADVKQRALGSKLALAGGVLLLLYCVFVIGSVAFTNPDSAMGQTLGIGTLSLFSLLKLGFWVTLFSSLLLIFQAFVPREVNLDTRQSWARFYGRFFSLANVLALIALIALFTTILNQAFGLIAVKYAVDPATLSDRPLEELAEPELILIIESGVAPDKIKTRLSVVVRDYLSVVDKKDFAKLPLSQVLAGRVYPPERAENVIGDLEVSEIAKLIEDNFTQPQMVAVVNEQVVKPQIVQSWRLFDSLFNRSAIEQEVAARDDLHLKFHSWVNLDFISRPISSSATTAGLRTALLGSMWIIIVTVAFAFPVGVGAAIYLEEYAQEHPIRVNLLGLKFNLNTLIETNVRNLAGVPSIIYGMLGLAVFVRAWGEVTSGAVFGVTDTNGRTVLSAGLTMGLLILPVVIISAQEAIRAVPRSIREASFGVGATKWQTIARQVLPAALPGILTGVILSMSRAVGETAPLIVVGASTFIGIDPNGPFSKFTVVPIQIYQWTGRPELEFKNVAAAAIIVLLALLLLLNGTAIFLRQRYSRRLS